MLRVAVKVLLKKNKMKMPLESKIRKQRGSGGRSQDGGGVGRGDHFLFYKFIERTTER